MNQATALLVFLLTLSYLACSQVDYLEYKDRYNLSCGIPDSAVIARNQQLVDSLQHMKISSGKKVFLYDHGWVYYMRYIKWKNLDDLRVAAVSFEKGWTEHNDLNALWNLGTIYRALENCDKALDMTDLYINSVPDSIPVDYKQVYYRYKYCRIKK